MKRILAARSVGLGLIIAFAAASLSVLPATPSFAATVWSQVGEDIDGGAFNDISGYSVSSSSDGSRVAIGAPYNSGGGTDAGQVRIFDVVGGVWLQVGADINGEAAFDESGWSVSLSGDGSRVAIGAPDNDGGGGNAGQVRIFDFDGSAWLQVGADIYGEADFDFLGESVSLSSDGSRVAIGAPSSDGGGSNAGQVRIFNFTGTAWVQVGADINGEAAGDQSGWSVSLSGDGSRVAIGARLNDGSGADAGQVRIFDFNGTLWGQVGADINGEAAGDESGHSVSVSSDGTRVAIGAPNNDNDGGGTDAGQVRIFDFTGAMWVQVGGDIDGEAAGDVSGLSVSLSGVGSRVAIGAPFNSGGSPNAGQVRVFDFTGAMWVQVGADINGEADTDFSGLSVSLSGVGSRVAIGAPNNNNDGGSTAGQVRVFTQSPPATERLFGPDRYSTAVEVSLSAFPDGADAVFIATGTGFADALSAAPAAADQGGPLLLTQPNALPQVVIDELVRLAPITVWIVGGTGVVSTAVENAISALDFAPTVERISGLDRFATSRAIAEEFFAAAPNAFVATGSNFPDALAAGPAAAEMGAPVILVPGGQSTVDAATVTLLNSIGPETVFVAGGVGAVSGGIATQIDTLPGITVDRLAGADRYSTAVAINDAIFGSTSRAYVVTGLSFADALAGGAAAANQGAPLYTTPPQCLPSTVLDSITLRGASTIYILGGTSVLSVNIENLVVC